MFFSKERAAPAVLEYSYSCASGNFPAIASIAGTAEN
jgi:hypothetical protein